MQKTGTRCKKQWKTWHQVF